MLAGEWGGVQAGRGGIGGDGGWLAIVETWLCHSEAGFYGVLDLDNLCRSADVFAPRGRGTCEERADWTR